MDVIQFSTEFNTAETQSSFVYSANSSSRKPTQIYRYDNTKFELRNVSNQSVVCEFKLDDIIKVEAEKDINIRLQYVQYVYLKDKLHFFVATRTLDGLETYLYLFDPSTKPTLGRLYFTRKLRGNIANISISSELQIESNEDHGFYIVTVGTLDSAIYVFCVASDITVPALNSKHPIPCALVRTDAKNALSQAVIVLDHQNTYLACGGFNGVIDFFRIKTNGDVLLEQEPELGYVKHQLIKLPTNLPVISIHYQKDPDHSNQILLIVSQELVKMSRTSRAQEPCVSVIKMDAQKLMGKGMVSTKFPTGTRLSPISKKEGDDFELYTCYLDSDEQNQLMISWCKFKTGDFTFQDKINSFLIVDERLKEYHQVAILDQNSCWMLGKEVLFQVHHTKVHKRGSKRQLDT